MFKDWLKSKGKTDIYVCVECNLIEIPAKSWCFGSGYFVHITNILHGFEKGKLTGQNTYNVFVGRELSL